MRIGVPAGASVDLVHAGVALETRRADSWQLLSFDIHPHYPNGDYALRVAEDSYSFIVTHSQA